MDTRACTVCGHQMRAGAKFCDECGTPVQPQQAERKQVTVLFCDVVGSMKLAEALDPERLREIMHDLFNRSAMIVQRYGGTVDKFTGDGLMALFGAPTALEDHALRAAVAAAAIHSAAGQLAHQLRTSERIELQIRIGLNSGEVVTGNIGEGSGRYTAIGRPVGMAQRMEAAAPPGGTLCALSTAELIRESAVLGDIEYVLVKNEPDRVPARTLLGIAENSQPRARDYGPMLGRESELDTLMAAVDNTRRSGMLIGVVGAPGVGKSRLVREFTIAAHAHDADVVLTRCEAHTAGVPLRAFARVARSLFGIDRLDDADARSRIAHQLPPRQATAVSDFLGIAETSSAGELLTPDAMRHRVVDAMSAFVAARHEPTAMIVEDIHWIDAASADALVLLHKALADTPSALVLTYRPEYRGELRYLAEHIVELTPLTEPTSIRLITDLLGADATVRDLTRRIASAAAGNPYFAEEIIRDLAGRGLLTGTRGAYRMIGQVDDITVPSTVQSVLAARIDRLTPTAKAILNAAAVIGSRFDVDTVAALTRDVNASGLAELVAAELIDQIEFAPSSRYAFRHPLVRTVAYESQLSSVRVEAHRLLADTISRLDPGNDDENAAMIATHLEAAGQLTDSYHWHMRAANWHYLHNVPAARLSWQHARRVADQLGDGDHAVSLRIAPRALLARTAYQSEVTDAESNYAELRRLTSLNNDLLSRAIGAAGHIILLSQLHGRLGEATELSYELAETLTWISGSDPVKALIYQAVVYTQFMVGDIPMALQNSQRQHRLTAAGDQRVRLFSIATDGVIEIVTGHFDRGREHLMAATVCIPPGDAITQAQLTTYWATLVAHGIEHPADVLPLTEQSVRMAEELGDGFGCACAWWARGAVLLALADHDDEATTLLRQARAEIAVHNNPSLFLPVIDAGLATCAARAGDLDGAVDQMRSAYDTYFDEGSPWLTVAPATGLVDLLLARGTADDVAEAERVVAQVTSAWAPLRSTIMAVARARANTQLARARGQTQAFHRLARQHLLIVDRFDARGRRAEAQRWVDETT